MITLEKLKETLDYDKKSGIFTWKVSNNNRIKIGDVAVSKNSTHGYISIKIENKHYRAHRLAWFMTYGYWAKEIDHIDRNRKNNAIRNLRDVSRSANMMNRMRKDGKPMGVSFCKTKLKWHAHIGENNKKRILAII